MWRIRTSRLVRRQVDDLPGHLRQRMKRLVESLATEPRLREAKELHDLPGYYRIPLQHWRLIYRVDDEAGLVVLLAVRLKTGPETYHDLTG